MGASENQVVVYQPNETVRLDVHLKSEAIRERSLMHVIISSLILLSFVLFSLPCNATYVKGHYRKDGTYVAPHYRRSSTTPRSTMSYSSPATSYTGLSTSYGAITPSETIVTRTSQATVRQESCAWNDEYGTPCKRSANPGCKYCYRHVGLTPPSTTHNDDARQDVAFDSASVLSLGEIPIARGVLSSASQISAPPKNQWKKQNLTLAVGGFFGMMFLLGLGFAAFSHSSIPNKIVRTLLTIPGALGVSLLFYWYIPVRQSIDIANLASDKTSADCRSWSWSATPQSRLLFVCSREKINDDCAQLVLNGMAKRYAGIVFPKWLVVPLKQTVPVVAKFDNNDPLEDPWIRSKDGDGIYVPWPMQDFIEAAEASKDFGVTLKDKAGVLYTFTFDIRKLQLTLGPDRKYFIEGK